MLQADVKSALESVGVSAAKGCPINGKAIACSMLNVSSPNDIEGTVMTYIETALAQARTLLQSADNAMLDAIAERDELPLMSEAQIQRIRLITRQLAAVSANMKSDLARMESLLGAEQKERIPASSRPRVAVSRVARIDR